MPIRIYRSSLRRFAPTVGVPHFNPFKALWPGILASASVSVGAVIIGWGESAVFRRAIIEPLVLAILIGMVVRTVRGDHPREDPGVRFIAKPVLEFAVFLLGATMDVPRLFASGPMLAVGIVVLVCVSLGGQLAQVMMTLDALRVPHGHGLTRRLSDWAWRWCWLYPLSWL